MKLKVLVTPVARRHIRKLNAWWRAKREKAPTLFRDELRRKLSLLAENPHIGWAVENTEIENVRCHPVRVRKLPYLIFYVVDLEAGVLRVEAVWSGVREDGPDL